MAKRKSKKRMTATDRLARACARTGGHRSQRAAMDVPNTHPSVAEDVGAIAAAVNQPTPPAFHNAPKHGGIFDV